MNRKTKNSKESRAQKFAKKGTYVRKQRNKCINWQKALDMIVKRLQNTRISFAERERLEKQKTIYTQLLSN
jgi:hypothetical protein